MPQSERPRLIEDSVGRKKVKVSLPGGRYQLSLNDSGINLLCDSLEYRLRDIIPDEIVRVLVATGDAWFPHQRDYQSVAEDLPNNAPLSETDKVALASYLQTVQVSEARISFVREVLSHSTVRELVDPEEITELSLPEVPGGIFDSTTAGTTKPEQSGENGSTQESLSSETKSQTQDTVDEITDSLNSEISKSRSWIKTRVERLSEKGATPAQINKTLKRQCSQESGNLRVFDIPGVGTIRGYNLISAGLDSVDQLAETRPSDIAAITHISEQAATAVVEGAREILGYEKSTAHQLSTQTNKPIKLFDAALSQLAAAGVPPSAAESTLRAVYGPTVADIDCVDGRMAFFLYQSGYTDPWEIAQATAEELEEVDYLGPNTAQKVIDGANKLLE